MNLDEGWARIRDRRRRSLVIVSPPGCGKTEALALRAEVLFSKLGPHERILALTFTNRARDNLHSRLDRHLGYDRSLRGVSVRTFHGYAAEVVLSHGRTIGLDVDRSSLPINDRAKKRFDEFCPPGQDVSATKELISKLKRMPLSDADIMARLEDAGDHLGCQVEADRISKNELDYEDLLRHAQRLLLIEEVAHLFQCHYAAVLVDEFQDMTLQQLDIVERTCSRYRTYCGDPLQGIFGFAGAQPREVEERISTQEGEPIHLSVSYRSSPAVLDMVNAVSGTLRGVPISCHEPGRWSALAFSAALSFRTRQDEANFLVQAISVLMVARPDLSIGIIVRSSWRRRALVDALDSLEDVPVRIWDQVIDDQALYDYIQSRLAQLPKGTGLEGAQQAILAGLPIDDVWLAEDVREAFNQMRTKSLGDASATLAQFRKGSRGFSSKSGVNILNAHNSKGHEFDIVVVLGLENGHIPDSRNDQDEELRVLLVMLSRARAGVIVTRADTSSNTRSSSMSGLGDWWDVVASRAGMTDRDTVLEYLSVLRTGASQ